jgi:hypothetical protein
MKNLLLPALLCALTGAPAAAQTSPQVRSVPTFHAIKVGSGIALDLTAGHSQRVEVRATADGFRDHILTTVNDGVLTIDYDNPGDRNGRERSQQHVTLHVAVTADELTALRAGGGSSVQATGNFAAAEFALDVSSGAALKADIATNKLTVEQGSGSTVALKGWAPSADIRTGSGALFNGKNLQTDHCRADASSGSSISLDVKDDLVAQASSGASITYSGSPQVTKHASSGASISHQ